VASGARARGRSLVSDVCPTMLDAQDWRLEARLDGRADGPLRRRLRRALPRRVQHPLGADLAGEVSAAVEHDVVVTDDGPVVYAYGASQSELGPVRDVVDAVLAHRGLAASVVVSVWDDTLGAWRQVDPPLSGALGLSAAAAVRDAATVETRTLVCIAGNLVRDRLEHTMLKSAGILGIECAISEHQRLLTTQVSFTVTGPRGKLDTFRAHLVAQGWATIRADALTMSPAR